jgi:hypothetical protein
VTPEGSDRAEIYALRHDGNAESGTTWVRLRTDPMAADRNPDEPKQTTPPGLRVPVPPHDEALSLPAPAAHLQRREVRPRAPERVAPLAPLAASPLPAC